MMQQGKAENNKEECWWCGLSIKYHPKSNYDNYMFIGSMCKTEIAKSNYQHALLEQSKRQIGKESTKQYW